MDRAPEISRCCVVTPMWAYRELIRRFRLGRYCEDTSPSEVESPMWTTEWQDVLSDRRCVRVCRTRTRTVLIVRDTVMVPGTGVLVELAPAPASPASAVTDTAPA